MFSVLGLSDLTVIPSPGGRYGLGSGRGYGFGAGGGKARAGQADWKPTLA